MFKGKMKAVTFSYDDGVTQDKRLIELLNKYNLKGTFNLNSETLGMKGELIREGVRVDHIKFRPEEVRSVYAGHEIAVHTLTHPFLTALPEEEVIRQVEQDRINLTGLAGYEVVGMAYPGGGINFSVPVAEIIRKKTGVKYARTTRSVYTFDLPSNPWTLHPSVSHLDYEGMEKLALDFLSLEPETPALFYIWGHSYEFDIHDTWAQFEDFLKLISGKDDIFYGTNRECLGL